MMKTEEKSYRPIPAVTPPCFTALSIKPPGSWFDDTRYVIFVGGSGIARADTEEEAEALLLDGAKRYCRRRIEAARREAEHYELQLAILDRDRLVPA